jgi:hypothetical protein
MREERRQYCRNSESRKHQTPLRWHPRDANVIVGDEESIDVKIGFVDGDLLMAICRDLLTGSLL